MSQVLDDSCSPPVILTIAGSDTSAGAGIQADLKTFSALCAYGATVITTLTAQNTCGVRASYPVPADQVTAQLTAVLDDMPVRAIKLGALGSGDNVAAIIETLNNYQPIPLVIDPVITSSSGTRLLDSEGESLLKSALLPRCRIVTPNIPEAAFLAQRVVPNTLAGMYELLNPLHDLGIEWVLLKGGHLSSQYEAIDLLSNGTEVIELRSARTHTKNTHGTGCTLASAVAVGIGRGQAVPQAVRFAKEYISGAILAADQLQVGQGSGPLHHFSLLWESFERNNIK
ncbi:bifunctional hydroxymethylpyrimidine kinase/phosphomethylpyrimidine kinase [Neptunomonas concharum]|uniref:hydroxymethylpyrimidine kinase n=1 Tax=Neptunomonas concharum TaxID=1031538 RepID=A0A5P1RE48_9GAMM|nr:bifunctional hydroxymethylpyrimidine kinase/phosphomethylpyrimidine kinase [Neptunomonas concharum]QEQ97877.1 bifunctional hydroxymethylpyrimidine kinase/phosphomethylpyrimidine kinase [Neptunomonas concharum]